MHLFSPSSSTSTQPSFTLLSPSQNRNATSKFSFKIPSSKTRTIPCSACKQSPPVLDKNQLSLEMSRNNEVVEAGKEPLDRVLWVRRPEMEVVNEDSGEGEDDDDESEKKTLATNEKKTLAIIDAGLEEFAKKMPMFEPERVESNVASSQVKPLLVNLELALYKAKVLARNYRYEEAQMILEKCISYWPEEGRPYVALGRLFSRQSKTAEARAVYEKGCQATQGENPYIWQCWAVLEKRMGNVKRARKLFDAATVADKKHIAAWHGWAVLELKQGNVKKARQLLLKGLKFANGNEYVYQTLALLEARANRHEQARCLFKQATKCNPTSCASWLAWAQLEMTQENNYAAMQLFEKAVKASPKNRFAWHIWGVFEANLGNIEKARKLLKIGHALNPRDPVLLQSLALLEYKNSSANLARALFRKASELDPRHQPVWFAWGWMEWKEGNISTARELYQKAISIDSTTQSAARCLQAWGVLEQRVGNLTAARNLFRSSLNVNSQSYVTWMSWAQLEEDQGNSVRAEEIRNLYFQQRTEVVDDDSWVMGFFDIIDPALDSIKRLLNLDPYSYKKTQESLKNVSGANENTFDDKPVSPSVGNYDGNATETQSGFDLDSFITERLSLDPTKLDVQLESSGISAHWKSKLRQPWRFKRTATKLSRSSTK